MLRRPSIPPGTGFQGTLRPVPGSTTEVNRFSESQLYVVVPGESALVKVLPL
jgi:hypothetical protein